MRETISDKRMERLRTQIHQLILLRETGPKSAGWHAARARLIWRLQEELKRAAEDATRKSERQEPAERV
jgi:hypothetical protein